MAFVPYAWIKVYYADFQMLVQLVFLFPYAASWVP